MKITKRFRFSDYDKGSSSKSKKFSKSFKEIVGLCLDQDPSKRPSAEKLLEHSFFRNCRGSDFLVKNVLNGLPTVEQRFREAKLKMAASMNITIEGDEDDAGSSSCGENVKQRRISGWNFNVEDFELDPVFPTEKEDTDVVKQVHFAIGEETIIPDYPEQVSDETQVGGGEAETTAGAGVDWELFVARLLVLKRSLDEQRQKVVDMISMAGGEDSGETSVLSREEKLMQYIERLRSELDKEKRKNLELDMELEFFKLQLSHGSDQ